MQSILPLGIDLFNQFLILVRNGIAFTVGYYMVSASKMVVRQVTAQRNNSSIVYEKHSEKVLSLEKKIYILTFADILLSGMQTYSLFSATQAALQEEF